MSIHTKVSQWRNVARFCSSRAVDYAELLALELDEAKARLVREVIAMVVLAVAGMFTLSFLCVAIIVTAWNTPYVVAVAWGVAAAWLVISIITFAMMKTQKPAEPLLQRLDPLADGRWCDVQLPRRRLEAAFAEHRGEGSELAGINLHQKF